MSEITRESLDAERMFEDEMDRAMQQREREEDRRVAEFKMARDARQENDDYEAGSEMGNCYREARSASSNPRLREDNRRRAEIENLRQAGRYVVVSLSAIHCATTDAHVRTGAWLEASCATESCAGRIARDVARGGLDVRVYAPRRSN